MGRTVPSKLYLSSSETKIASKTVCIESDPGLDSWRNSSIKGLIGGQSIWKVLIKGEPENEGLTGKSKEDYKSRERL